MLSRSKGNEVPSSLLHVPDFLDKLVQILPALDEIDLACVDDEKGRSLVVEKEVVVGLGDAAKIVEVDLPFVGKVAGADPLKQDLWPRLEEDHKIGGGDAVAKELEDLLVEAQLVFVKVQGGKEAVSGEEVVTKGHLVKEARLGDFLLLLKSIEKKEDLCLEGVFLPILVESAEKGILFGPFQETPSVELLCQDSGEARLANPDRAFDHDIAKHRLTLMPS